MDIETINALLDEIIKRKILKKGVVKKVLSLYNKTGEDIIDLLISFKADKDSVMQILGEILQMPYVNLASYDLTELVDYTEFFSKNLADRYNGICFQLEGQSMKIAFYEKPDPFSLNSISMYTKFDVIPYLAYKGDILALKEKLYNNLDNFKKRKKILEEVDDEDQDYEALPEPTKSKPKIVPEVSDRSISIDLPSSLTFQDSNIEKLDFKKEKETFEKSKPSIELGIDADLSNISVQEAASKYIKSISNKYVEEDFSFSKSRSKFNNILKKNKFSLIVSLPENNANLAKLAFSAGADAIKVHINVLHHASNVLFSNFDIEMKKIREILSVVPIPVGIVPGEKDMASLKEFERMKNINIDFIDVYYRYYRPYMFNISLGKMVALDKQFLIEYQDLSILTAIEEFLDPIAYELSIVDEQDYGQAFTLEDLLLYKKIAKHTKRPLIVPTQKKIKPSDLYTLYLSGIKGIMVGVIVLGRDEETFASNIQKYRKEINNLIF